MEYMVGIKNAALYTVAAIALAVGASGCMGNTEVEAGVRIKQKEVIAPPKENYSEALNKVYDPKDSLHNQSRIRQDTLDKVLTSPFMDAYQNRDR